MAEQAVPPGGADLDEPDIEHWQLEFIDQQLADYQRARTRHRADVRMYEQVGASLPMRYHAQQVATCTHRINNLLDLRIGLVQGEGQG